MRRYTHVQNMVQTEYNWQDNLLKRTTSTNAWRNPITRTFLLYVERMLVIGWNRIKQIESYFKI